MSSQVLFSSSLAELAHQRGMLGYKAGCVLLRPSVPADLSKQACSASAKDSFDKYKKWTFLSLVPISVLQQAAWLSYGAEENRPGALFSFLAYAWPIFVRRDFEFDESFRIPFVFTFITSFLHLQCVLFEEGIHPLVSLLSNMAEKPEEDGFLQEVSAIEEKRREENKQEEVMFDKRLALRGMKVSELKQLAREQNLKGRSKMRKADLVAHLEASDGIIQKLKKL